MTVKKQVANKITAMIEAELRGITNQIDSNRHTIRTLAEANAVLKREREPLTELLREWKGNKT
jgi:hypothetical protein